MSDRIFLFIYLSAVVIVSLLHRPGWLAIGLCLVIVFAGSMRWRLLRKALLSMLLFNVTVSLGYALLAGIQGEMRIDYLLLINLRVLLLLMLGFWLNARINIANALGFSSTLSFLATVAAGQARVLSRVVSDFSDAFESRRLKRPGWRERTRLATAQTQVVMEKAQYAATEISQAMRSRGVFDD
ncbi:MAG: ABC transporter permease [Candidatus Thiodiazotropha sp. (ex Dulcina madagascariensis)]|nr:ABC transporter permease [Candidatus Thiodiazotropha sp. (ex Dulcina madagascariensis)]MCU7926061.1 ABC transporter permease [Candidatus Thiodiazotropha sp. (ex Dulcina madagascariensis)]